MSKFRVVVVLTFVMSFVQAQSQTPEKSSHYKAAEEYMVALNMEQTINGGIDDMVEMQAKSNPGLAGKKEAFKKFMMKHMSWNVVREDYLKMYMDEFTEAELKHMRAFYRTPTGKKVAAKQNVITMKATQLGQDKMQANMSELMQVMQ